MGCDIGCDGNAARSQVGHEIFTFLP